MTVPPVATPRVTIRQMSPSATPLICIRPVPGLRLVSITVAGAALDWSPVSRLKPKVPETVKG